MNEATKRQSDQEDGNTRVTSAAGPQFSAAAKAQELPRTATERSQELRRAAVREQALREKMRRLESVSRQLEQRNSDSFGADGTLANLSDANWDEIKEQLDRLHAEAEQYIRDNPTKSVLAAAGVGFVLGLLMKR
jgi:ElaB/YqjD/DUF883 family membrane-anchored ribosome-binding protein